MTKNLLSLIVLLAISRAVVNAADVQWFGGAGDRDWFNTANWGPSGGPIPTVTDKAKVNYVWANPGPIISSPGAIANEIFISEDRDWYTIGEQSLTLATGGELTVNGQVILGYFGASAIEALPPNEGRLIIDGGTANIGSNLFVGFSGTGHLVVNSGILNVGGIFGIAYNSGYGDVIINGGTLHTANYSFNWEYYNSWGAHMLINGGEWMQDGNHVSEIQALIDNGTITSDVGTLRALYDGQHTIVPVPEPVSIALVGLGALLMRKRSYQNIK